MATGTGKVAVEIGGWDRAGCGGESERRGEVLAAAAVSASVGVTRVRFGECEQLDFIV